MLRIGVDFGGTKIEAAALDAAGSPSVFGVILGTGCGGGFVVPGRLHEGANGIGGEWGHEPLAAAALERWLDRVARGLAMLVNVLDPATFVFGGGVSNVDELHAGLAGRMRPWIFSDAWEARLVAARWGDSSGVRGAARLW
jgi:fructokinase